MKVILKGFFVLIVMIFLPLRAISMERAWGWCEQGQVTLTVGGVGTIPQPVQGSYPSCTVTVYISGFISVGITSITRASGVVTATFSGTVGFPTYAIGSAVTVAGVTDASYNGSFTATGGTANTITWNQAGSNTTSSGGTAALLPAIFSDNAVPPTALANPFTASSKGYYEFYAVSGRYDVRISGGSPVITPPLTLGDLLLYDPVGPNSDIPQCIEGGICFADRFASGSITGGIAEAINALPSTGGTVFIRPNYTASLTTGVLTGTKIVNILCSDQSSVISGTGFSLVTIQSSGSSIENCTVQDLTGNASTVAIDVNNGSTGISDWHVRNCKVVGSNLSASGPEYGIGINLHFAIAGTVEDSNVEGWNYGLQFSAAPSTPSNSVLIHGNDIHLSTVGIEIPTGGAYYIPDSVTIVGNTIEGNLTGIELYSGSVQSIGNHFENFQGSTPGINVRQRGNSTYNSISNAYFGATWDIQVDAGETTPLQESSTADTFAVGVLNNGSLSIVIIQPVDPAVLTTSGSGIIQFISGKDVRVWTGVLAGPFTVLGGWTASQWIPASNLIVTRVQFSLKFAAVGCSSLPPVILQEGGVTSIVTFNLVNGTTTYDSGLLSTLWTAGSQMAVLVNGAASGCSTNPSDGTMMVQYRMAQ